VSLSKRTYEISTNSFDPSFQLSSSDPSGGGINTGLLIPSAPSTRTNNRYLFAVAGAGFGASSRGRVRGIRQYATIGATTSQSTTEPPETFDYYNVETPITTPTWRFADGSISWHLMRVPIGRKTKANHLNGSGLAHRYARQDALIYETLAPYVAPFDGQPQGTTLCPSLGCWHDLRFPWQSSHAWESVDIPFEGPCQIVLFASVWQTNPATRTTLNLGDSPAIGLPPEENFILALGDFAVNYRRIAGSLIFDEWQTGGGP
jgi:hypothetical protein